MTEESTEIAPPPKSNVAVSSQDEFIGEWARTEETLKSLERSQGIVLVPAYIGLRNANRHFVEALNHLQDGSGELAERALGSSVKELRRSRHDALRAQIEFCHYRLLVIEESYPSERIHQVCPEYFDIQDRIEEVTIKLNSDFRDLSETEEYYVELETSYLPKLMNVFDKLTVARTAVLEEIKQTDVREERYKKLAVGGVGVGLAGLAVALVSFFF